MPRALIVFGVGLAVATTACKRTERAPAAPPVVAVTAAEAEAFAGQLAAALSPCDPAAVDRLFDRDATIARIIADRDLVRGAEVGVGKGFPGMGEAALCRSPPTSYHYLRVVTDDGQPQPLFRTVVGPGVGYIRIVLTRTAAGVRGVDFYRYAGGALFSTTIGDTVEASGDKLGTAKLLVDFRHAIEAHDPVASQGAIAKLPAKIRDSKAFRLALIQQYPAGAAARTALVDQYLQAFPGDPSIDLVSIDSLVGHGDYDGALAAIDRVDRAVGGDPYQDASRAYVLALAKHLERAVESATQATLREPTLETGWRALVSAELQSHDIERALAAMTELRTRFHVTFDDAELAKAQYQELRDSPLYAAWKVAP